MMKGILFAILIVFVAPGFSGQALAADGFQCEKSAQISSGPSGLCWNEQTGAIRSTACEQNPRVCRNRYWTGARFLSGGKLENPSLLSFGSPDFRVCLKAGGRPEQTSYSWKGQKKNIGICWLKDKKIFASTGQVTTWVLETNN